MSPKVFWWGFAGICAAAMVFGPVAKGAEPTPLDLSRLVVPALLLGLYFTPTLIAWNHHDPHIGRIFLLNLVLGWTPVGWAIVLIRAMLSPMPAAPEPLSLPCPHCAEAVLPTARVCRWCGHAFDLRRRRQR